MSYLCMLHVALCSDDESLTDADEMLVKSLTTRSLMAWDVMSKSSPADSCSTATSK